MKINTLISIALAALAISANAATEKTFKFEVRSPMFSDPVILSVKAGESKDATAMLNPHEYTASQVTVPKSTWDAMTQTGNTPKHDELTCNSKHCTYSIKQTQYDSLRVTIAPVDSEGEMLTRISLSKVTALAATTISGITAPSVNEITVTNTIPMKSGDSFPIQAGEESLALVRLISVK